MHKAASETRLDVSLTVFDQGTVTVERIELPERGPGEIDVRITLAAICGSDVHTILGHRTAPPRTALGHEGVGRITAADDGATDLRGVPLKRGDRVVFSMLAACGHCDRCNAGLTMKCRTLLKYGHESVTTPPFATGTLATSVRLVPNVPVLRIPDDVEDVHVVSAGCAVATAAAIVAAAGTTATGTPALVFGAGAVGAFCAAMLTTLGCVVHVREPAKERLAAVQRFGARADAYDGRQYPLVIEASGNADALVDALRAADVGGRIIAAGSVSPGGSTAVFDPALLVTRRLAMVGIHNYTAGEFRWGVDWLLAHGRNLGMDRLVSPPMPLPSVNEAFRQMQKGQYARILVHPDGTGDGSR